MAKVIQWTVFKNHKNWLIVKDYNRKVPIQWSVLQMWKPRGNEELPISKQTEYTKWVSEKV